jgi:SAM-dependent methyltransferase
LVDSLAHPLATTADDAARAANLDTYEAASTVTSYIADRYHAVRRELATALLHAALDADDAPDGGVLEIGSGAESLLGDSDGGRPHFCADIAVDALRSAKGALACFDVTRPLPLADESLAAIVLGELIEHLFYPKPVLAEFRRTLRPGGVLVITTPNLATLQDRVRFIAGRSPRQVDAAHPYLFLHIRPFTASSLRDLLEGCGFEVLALRSNFVGWRRRNGRWWEFRLLAKLAPSIGGSLIVSARRR